MLAGQLGTELGREPSTLNIYLVDAEQNPSGSLDLPHTWLPPGVSPHHPKLSWGTPLTALLTVYCSAHPHFPKQLPSAEMGVCPACRCFSSSYHGARYGVSARSVSVC